MQSFDTNADNTHASTETNENHFVCSVDALPNGSCRRFSLPNGDELAIYNIDGEFYAIDNFCPHRGAPLTDGVTQGHIVECGWHGWQFDVRTGECLTVREKISVFPVTVIEGKLFVRK